MPSLHKDAKSESLKVKFERNDQNSKVAPKMLTAAHYTARPESTEVIYGGLNQGFYSEKTRNHGSSAADKNGF